MPASTPRPRAALLAVAAAIVVGVILLAFSWPLVTAEPRDVPVGIAGPQEATAQLGAAVEQNADGAVALTSYPDRAAAVTAIEQREVYGAIVLGAQPEVLTATAANAQVAQLLQGIAAQLEQSGDATVTVTDLVPYAESDARGSGFAAAAFPLVLGGMVGAAAIALGVRGAGRQLLALGVYTVTGGLLLTGILQGWFGALQGGFWPNAATVALTLAGISGTIVGLRGLLGMPGLGLGAVLMVLFANPISGATMPVEFLLAPWGAIGQWFPPGASMTLLRDLSYFPAADASALWWTLIGWAVLGVGLTALGLLRARRDQSVPSKA